MPSIKSNTEYRACENPSVAISLEHSLVDNCTHSNNKLVLSLYQPSAGLRHFSVPTEMINVYLEFSTDLYFLECISAYNYSHFGLQIPAHSFKRTWLLIMYTCTQSAQHTNMSSFTRRRIWYALCFPTQHTKRLSHPWFVYHLNHHLPLSMFESSCLLSASFPIKKHFLQRSQSLLPNKLNIQQSLSVHYLPFYALLKSRACKWGR